MTVLLKLHLSRRAAFGAPFSTIGTRRTGAGSRAPDPVLRARMVARAGLHPHFESFTEIPARPYRISMNPI
jgi:hypothetical protein